MRTVLIALVACLPVLAGGCAAEVAYGYPDSYVSGYYGDGVIVGAPYVHGPYYRGYYGGPYYHSYYARPVYRPYHPHEHWRAAGERRYRM